MMENRSFDHMLGYLSLAPSCRADIVTVLLERLAEVNPRDNQGRTPLVRAERWHQNNTAQILKQHGGTE